MDPVVRGDGAATGPEGIEVDHGNRDQPATDGGLEIVVTNSAFGDQTDVE